MLPDSRAARPWRRSAPPPREAGPAVAGQGSGRAGRSPARCGSPGPWARRRPWPSTILPAKERMAQGQALGTTSRSDASGRQANRNGAYLLVPRPAETCSQLDPSATAPHLVPRQVAVGHQRPHPGRRTCPPWVCRPAPGRSRCPRRRPGPAGKGCGPRPGARDLAVGGDGHGGVVAADVGVVHAGQLDVAEPAAVVGQHRPAPRPQALDQLPPGVAARLRRRRELGPRK